MPSISRVGGGPFGGSAPCRARLDRYARISRAAPGQNRAITKTKVRAIVQNRHVAFAKQPGDRAQRAAKSTVEKHRVLASEKFRDAPFEFAMEIGHS